MCGWIGFRTAHDFYTSIARFAHSRQPRRVGNLSSSAHIPHLACAPREQVCAANEISVHFLLYDACSNSAADFRNLTLATRRATIRRGKTKDRGYGVWRICGSVFAGHG